MAATRLIALHVNKGKTVAQCLADRTDYSQNAAKTNDGEFISSYECDPKTANAFGAGSWIIFTFTFLGQYDVFSFALSKTY